jgi:hypothetical protein
MLEASDFRRRCNMQCDKIPSYSINSTSSPQRNRDNIRDARALVLTATKRLYESVGVYINMYNLMEGRFDVIEGMP